MDELYGWVRNITYYLIFMTVVSNILPNKKYEKYIKLFAGMILILLVLQPLTGGLRLEDKLAYYFESITLQENADDLKKELLGMEDKRLEQMILQYEQAVAVDLEAMITQEGFYQKEIHVTIERNQDSPAFGMVTSIRMTVTAKKPEEAVDNGVVPIDPVTPVDPVIIQEQEYQEKSKEERRQEHTSINLLKNKIMDYYSLEADYVEIRLEDE